LVGKTYGQSDLGQRGIRREKEISSMFHPFGSKIRTGRTLHDSSKLSCKFELRNLCNRGETSECDTST
jgi:hypothetical protein